MAESSKASETRDDFEPLKQQLLSMANQQLVTQLEERGVIQRAKSLSNTLNNWRKELGDTTTFESIRNQWGAHWVQAQKNIVNAHLWKISPISELHKDTHSGIAARLFKTRESPMTLPSSVATKVVTKGLETVSQSAESTQLDAPKLVDTALLTDIKSAVEQFIQKVHPQGIPLSPLNRHCKLDELPLQQRLMSTTQQSLQDSLSHPGTSLQRGVYRATGWLCTVLPVLTMGWVGYRLVTEFERGGGNPGAYLGGNFAIHSGLLIGLAWLVPFVLHRQLKPSRRQAAVRGLRSGLTTALADTGRQINNALEELGQEHAALVEELKGASCDVQSSLSEELPESVQRMLFEQQA
jgi:hypothetical protein